MLIKELREIINKLPDDTDIVMQKRITNKWTMVAEVLKWRIAYKDNKERLVLLNMKPLTKKE